MIFHDPSSPLLRLGPIDDARLAELKNDPRRVELHWHRASEVIQIYYPWRLDEGAALGALGQKVYVRVGFTPTGRVGEIFCRGGSKHGERIDFALDKIGHALSVLLQIGEPLERLAELAPLKLAHYLLEEGASIRQQQMARCAIGAIVHAAIQLECSE